MAQSISDLVSADAHAPADHALAERLTASHAELAQLAASECDDEDLLSQAAAVLREALSATHVAVYADSGRPQPVAVSPAATSQHVADAACEPPDMLTRRERAAALAATRHAGGIGSWPALPRVPGCATRLVALAVGRGEAATVFVARVPAGASARANSAVDALRPGLSAVARAAYLRRELRRSERRQSQLQAIFTHSSEAILSVDRDFTILEGNPALSTLLELSDVTPVGQHCSQVLRCHDDRGQLLCGTPGCPLAQAFVLTNSAPYREVIWRTVSGKSKEVSASFAAVPSAEGVRGVIIARDMTPVNAANRMRSNFVSMVSHELRNPLNSINGFLEIVLEGHVGTLTRRQEEFLEYARMSTHQLMTLVEDILFISRADTGQFKLRIAAVSLAELTTQVMMQFRPVAERAQVALTVAIAANLPTIYVDHLRIQQVISNLINNAIKFTPPGGTVEVRASAAADAVTVEVSDTGAGIPIEDHERIFERFFQSAANSLTQAGGYGLGLAIAKLIVQQHGGRIWVQSTPDQGSTFAFTIPVRAQTDELPQAAS